MQVTAQDRNGNLFGVTLYEMRMRGLEPKLYNAYLNVRGQVVPCGKFCAVKF